MPERSWTDLPTNRPGESARTQAHARKQQAPVKTLFARMFGAHTDERAWRIGADGEEAVAARLGRLGDRWRVLHAVPVGNKGSDIDHVVIGPATAYVRNSRHEVQRAARLLTAAVGFPVPVTGLIVVVGAHRGLTIKSQPPGQEVFVLTRKEVGRWLERRGEILEDGQIASLYAAARRSTSWAG